MTRSRAQAVAAAAGIALATAGCAIPAPAAYVIGVLLCASAAALALRGRLWLAVGAAGVLAALGVGVPALALPATEGLSGDWATTAISGVVVADRAIVSPDNSSIDLRTGKTVRLGSVTGGTRHVGDDRMVVVGAGRVDSVRLDATQRWTWHPEAPSTVTPLAAAQGQTVLRVCPQASPRQCELVGVDARGRTAWATDAPGQTAATEPLTDAAGALPSVAVLRAPGPDAGLFLVAPETGQRTMVPGAAALPAPSGVVAVTYRSGGRCVTSLYAAPQPSWTRVADGACPDARPQAWFATATDLWVRRGETWSGYALVDGQTRQARPGTTPSPDDGAPLLAEVAGARTGANPFRSGNPAYALTLRDPASGKEVGRLVSEAGPQLLHLDARAIVVRTGGQVVRYTVDRT